MSEEKREMTLREHLTAIRKKVPAASCARDPEKMRRAARVRWDAKKNQPQVTQEKPVS